MAKDELAPDWYEPEAKSKKHKASAALRKELEKKKKAASTTVDEENEMLGPPSPLDGKFSSDNSSFPSLLLYFALTLMFAG